MPVSEATNPDDAAITAAAPTASIDVFPIETRQQRRFGPEDARRRLLSIEAAGHQLQYENHSSSTEP